MKKKFALLLYIIIALVHTRAVAATKPDENANLLTAQWIEQLQNSLREQEASASRVQVSLDLLNQKKLNALAPEEWKISQVTFSPRTQRFDAELKNASNDTTSINGRAMMWVKVPSLASPLPAKTVLKPEHLSSIEFPFLRVRPDTALTEEALVGQALRRATQAAQALSTRDVMKPIMIEKNHPVDIVYQTKFMQLSTSAIALEAGGEGDMIRVKNIDSEKIIRGVVANEHTVIMKPSMPTL